MSDPVAAIGAISAVSAHVQSSALAFAIANPVKDSFNGLYRVQG